MRHGRLVCTRVEWTSGRVRVGWLRAGEGMAFTAAAVTEAALRLATDEARLSAFAPARLFGPDVALAAGAEFLVTG